MADTSVEMNITIKSPDAKLFVKYYQPGVLTLNTGEQYQHSLILYQDKMIAWSPQNIADLDIHAINTLLDFHPGMIILATGTTQIFPGHQLLIPVYEQGIGIEVMKTEAACCTFNILVDEGRDVLAAFFIQ